jgi:hypothetical protein
MKLKATKSEPKAGSDRFDENKRQSSLNLEQVRTGLMKSKVIESELEEGLDKFDENKGNRV